MTRAFYLTTGCIFNAPPSVVWAEAINIRAYPEWWPSIKRMVIHGDDPQLQKNSAVTCYIKGFLPYTLVFNVRITDCVPFARLEMSVSGGLVGTGRFILEGAGETTSVLFLWNVDLGSTWLNSLAKFPPVHKLFTANHRYATQKAIKRMKLRIEHARR